jgi:hypothetical protein
MKTSLQTHQLSMNCTILMLKALLLNYLTHRPGCISGPDEEPSNFRGRFSIVPSNAS